MSRSTPRHLANRTLAQSQPNNDARQVMMMRTAVPGLVLLGGVALAAAQASAPSAPTTDAAFSNFFRARDSREAAAAADQIVASGVGFDEAFRRLKEGRSYSRDVARGTVQSSYRSETAEYFYTLEIPESYDAAHM